jgi:hypothetical protein
MILATQVTRTAQLGTRHSILFISAVLACTPLLICQTPRRVPSEPVSNSGSSNQASDEQIDPQSPAADMLVKSRIKREVRQHQENVDRAREAADLSTEIYGAFKKANSLNEADFKKLDRLEKLTKKIRDAAGGSDADFQLSDAPHDISGALLRINDASGELKDRVEKTSRMEVSASVIDRANEILELIKMVKNLKGSPG